MNDHEFASLTELGKVFGVTSHRVGHELKEWGYRATDGKPTPRAFAERLVTQRWSRERPEVYFWVWHRTKTLDLLESFGLERVIHPTERSSSTDCLDSHTPVDEGSPRIITYRYCTMRQLGALFGVSSHVIGRELKNLGLRAPDGQPSCLAQESGLVKVVAGPQPWVQLWVWHREMTVAILEGAGWERADGLEVAGGNV